MSFIHNNKKKRLHDLRSQATIWILLAWHPGPQITHWNYSHITLWQQLKLRSVFIRPQSHFVSSSSWTRHHSWGMKTRFVTPFITGKIRVIREESPTLKWKRRARWGWEMRPLTTGYSYQNQLSVIKCLLCTGDYANWFAYIILSKSQNKPIRQLVLSVPVYSWGTKV